jgi:hypothetical protein
MILSAMATEQPPEKVFTVPFQLTSLESLRPALTYQ